MSLEEHALEGHAQQEYDQLMLQFAKQQQTMFSTFIGYIYIYIYVYVYIYVCMYVCMYVCIFYHLLYMKRKKTGSDKSDYMDGLLNK